MSKHRPSIRWAIHILTILRIDISTWYLHFTNSDKLSVARDGVTWRCYLKDVMFNLRSGQAQVLVANPLASELNVRT